MKHKWFIYYIRIWNCIFPFKFVVVHYYNTQIHKTTATVWYLQVWICLFSWTFSYLFYLISFESSWDAWLVALFIIIPTKDPLGFFFFFASLEKSSGVWHNLEVPLCREQSHQRGELILNSQQVISLPVMLMGRVFLCWASTFRSCSFWLIRLPGPQSLVQDPDLLTLFLHCWMRPLKKENMHFFPMCSEKRCTADGELSLDLFLCPESLRKEL